MRKKLNFIVLTAVLIISSSILYSQIPEKAETGLNSIKAGDLEAQLSIIASDYTEGRETASLGYDLAARYAESLFKMWGIKPAGDAVRVFRRGQSRNSYFQSVPFLRTISVKESHLKVMKKSKDSRIVDVFEYRTDYSASNRISIEAETGVVFLGYGVSSEEDKFDEMKGVDLKGKVVLIIQGIPGETDKESDLYDKFRFKVRRYSFRNQMQDIMKEKGAAGIIYLPSSVRETPLNLSWATNDYWRNTGRNRFYEGDTPPIPRERFRLIRKAGAERDLFTITVTDKVDLSLLEGTGFTLEKLQKQIDSSGKPNSFEVKNTEISFKMLTNTEILKCKNVVGYIEGSDPELKEELVIVGAHLDHLGKRNNMIFNGADDNGSGSVGVMEIAEAFSLLEEKPKRSVVFCLWTGEEHGLCGSSYFVDHPFKSLDNIVYYQNFDMIGRNARDLEENKNRVSVTSAKQTPKIKEIIEKYSTILELDAQVREASMPSGGSDHRPFGQKDISYSFFITGMHDDYHQMTDHIDKINFEKMEKIVKVGFLTLYEIADMDERLTYDKSLVK